MKTTLMFLLCLFLAFTPALADETIVIEGDNPMVIVLHTEDYNMPQIELVGEDGSLTSLLEGAEFVGGVTIIKPQVPKENVTADHIALYWCLLAMEEYSFSETKTVQSMLNWLEEGAQPPFNYYTYTQKIFQEEVGVGLQIMLSDAVGLRLYVDPAADDITTAKIEKINLLVPSPYTGPLTMIEMPHPNAYLERWIDWDKAMNP